MSRSGLGASRGAGVASRRGHGQDNTGGDMREVKQLIAALKDKLMERHLMSKKIAELDKILQKINNATNKVLIEMDSRVDDLDRDWQKRLQIQNVKWKERINALTGCAQSSKPCETELTNAANPSWRTERRLAEITDRLASIARMEQNLNKIMTALSGNAYNQQQKNTTAPELKGNLERSENAYTEGYTSSEQTSRASAAPKLYGVVEVTETYSMCLRNLERALKSLESIKQMPALFGVTPGGISDVGDVNRTSDLLKKFIKKLKISLCKSNFSGSPVVSFDD